MERDVNKDETQQVGRGTNHSIYRDQLKQSQTYSDFRLAAETDERRAWIGPAQVNLTLNQHNYRFDSSFLPSPARPLPDQYEESGYDASASASTVAQGKIRFSRYKDQEDPKKTTCHIEVDGQEGWRPSSKRSELQVQLTGHSWRKYRPASSSGDYDRPVDQKITLGAWFHGIEFECDPKAKVISGKKRVTNPGGSEAMIYSLRRGPVPQVEVEIMPPGDYKEWLPEGGQNEKTTGNFLDILIVAHEKGKPDKKPPVRVKKYKLELVDVSNEKGVCLNWPAQGAQTHFGLKFDPEVNPYIKITDGESAQKAETKNSDLDQFQVTVNSYDWGAYGKLQVTAELEDDTTVQAHVHGESSSYALAIPKDDNGNHIADFWEKTSGAKTTDETSDEDERPAGDHNGDGLSLYEEYRGAHVNGTHERFNPNRKDVFIWDVSSLGTGYYPVSKFDIHLIRSDEKGTDGAGENPYTISPNRGHATLGPVYVLKLTRGEVGNGDAGEVFPPGNKNAWVPKDVKLVRIDTARIHQAAGDSPDVESEISSTIAHELGHASHLRHHGFSDYAADGDVLCRTSKGNVNYLCDTPGDPNKPRGKPGQAGAYCYMVAAKGGAWSGDASCIMRYNSGNFYEDPTGNCEWRRNGVLTRGREGEHQPAGTAYCQRRTGTGVNDPGAKPSPMAGDATNGECVFDLCINSNKH